MMLAPNQKVASLGELPCELPHNIEAEQALLGAILVSNAAMDRVTDVVGAADFYDPVHAQIFEAMATRISAGRLADAVSLADAFRNAPPIIDGLTVPAYIGRLAAAATTTANARAYAQTVRDLAVRREVIRICDDGTAAACHAAIDETPMALIENIEGQLFLLAERGETQSGPKSIKSALANAVHQSDEAFQRGGGIRGLSTGLIDLDQRLGGLAPGGLYVLAGRPGMGKTALATNIAWAVASAGDAVDFYSLEMSADELALRIGSQECGVSSEDFRRGNVDKNRLRSLRQAADRVSNRPLLIDDRGGVSVAQIAARAKRHKRRHDTALVVIDYLQLLRGNNRRDGNRVQEITEITTGLKAVAKELQVPIIALSQLSRQVEQRNDNRPMLSDLRESGSIEQDADAVIFVYREEYYVERKKPSDMDIARLAEWQRELQACSGKAEAIIAKNRHGSIGSVELVFDAALTRFDNVYRQAPTR